MKISNLHNSSSIIRLPFSVKTTVLAMGSEINSGFAVLGGDSVFISKPFGDLKNPQIFEDYKKAIREVRRKFKFAPKVIACDLHPDYISTKYAKEMRDAGGKAAPLEIQHHHAHIASCMAENGLRRRVIGVAFDGMGYGSDGKIWGAEFLLADYSYFKRAAHFAYVPMPGGDKAVLEPIRMAFAYLYESYGSGLSKLKSDVLRRIGIDKRLIFTDMVDKKINSPLTSSAGRLFDAAASLIGVMDCVSSEGEAAIRLEKMAASECNDTYEFNIKKAGEELIIEFWPMIKMICSDMKDELPKALIARRFHNTLAEAIKKVCLVLRKDTKLNDVLLSGGVFQNKILLKEAKKRLEKEYFSVYTHVRTPCSDRSLALGQAVVAASYRNTSYASGHFT